LGPYLAGAGYCVFSLTYGQPSPLIPIGGTIPIEQSSQQIKAFVEQVLAATGAPKLDLVGHSEGAFQSLYGPKVLGYSGQVDRVVAIAPPTHGTTFAGLVSIGDAVAGPSLIDVLLSTFGCPLCTELIVGGSAVKQLNTGPIAQPGVHYTIIASRDDELVTPTDTAFINEPGAVSEYVQDSCPADPVGHIGLASDSGVATMITTAPDPTTAKPVACTFGPPF
jgi:hypothetical protein